MIKPLIGATALLFAYHAHAIPTTAGSTSLTTNGNEYTFTFDQLSSDLWSSDGLYFTDGSISWSLYAEAFNDNGAAVIRQDAPAHGGLGVDGGTYGDNWEYGETIKLSLSGGQQFDIIGLSFNGGNAGAHQDCVPGGEHENGMFDITTSHLAFGGSWMNQFDGCDANGERPFWTSSSTGPYLNGITYVELSDWSQIHGNTQIDSGQAARWTGYLESVTIRTTNNSVPEPSIIALFAAGLFGIGFARRRKA